MKLSEIEIHLPVGENIAEWVDVYLRGIGGNIPLADGLQKVDRHWFPPLLLPISLLHRCCGPEDDMEYHISSRSFDETIERIV